MPREHEDDEKQTKASVHSGATGMNPVFLGLSRLRRRRFDDVIASADVILRKTPFDEAVWLLKTRAMTEKQYIDDTEMEEEGVAEILMDEHAVNKAPRPGTSLKGPGKASGNQVCVCVCV
jgi:tetratricopeptide repeat protein 8